MKYIISGSRRIKDYSVVADAITRAIEHFQCYPKLIIEGGQRTYNDKGEIVGGVDWFAQKWAKVNGVPVQTEKAKWSKYGLAAGPIRNRKMAAEGDVLVAIPDLQSKGTRDMIQAMREEGKIGQVFEASF